MNQKKSSIVDPLVKVEIYGVPADVAEKETKPFDNNGTSRSRPLFYFNVSAMNQDNTKFSVLKALTLPGMRTSSLTYMCRN